MTVATETCLAEIWCRLLQTDSVTGSSNFFLDGGDSQSLVRLALEIREKLGVNLSLYTIFDAQTFSGLRAEVESRLAAA